MLCKESGEIANHILLNFEKLETKKKGLFVASQPAEDVVFGTRQKLRSLVKGSKVELF